MKPLSKFHTNAITLLGYATSIAAAARFGSPGIMIAGSLMFSLFNGRMRGLRHVNDMLEGTFDEKKLIRGIVFNTVLCIGFLVATLALGPVIPMFTSYFFGMTIAWCIIDLNAIKTYKNG